MLSSALLGFHPLLWGCPLLKGMPPYPARAPIACFSLSFHVDALASLGSDPFLVELFRYGVPSFTPWALAPCPGLPSLPQALPFHLGYDCSAQPTLQMPTLLGLPYWFLSYIVQEGDIWIGIQNETKQKPQKILWEHRVIIIIIWLVFLSWRSRWFIGYQWLVKSLAPLVSNLRCILRV